MYYVITKVCECAFIINKKTKIYGSTPSNGQVVCSKKFLKVWPLTLRTFMIHSNFNVEVISSTCTCVSKCTILGPTVWTLYAKQRNKKRLTLKIKVKAIYDWLMFDCLTFLIDLQTHFIIIALGFSDLKKIGEWNSNRLSLKIKGYWRFGWLSAHKLSFVNVL